MALTLLIENYQILDDGGPASINVPESGLQVGRRAGMGWVLPDASRHISGHHFDVYQQAGEWWLRDVSTNGTFMHGMRHRLDGPHRLEHGDRFQVGQYIVVALMDSPVMNAAMNPSSLPSYEGPVFSHEVEEDPWSLNSGVPLAPVNPTPVQPGQHHPDFSQDFVSFPSHNPHAPAASSFAPPPPMHQQDAAVVMRGVPMGAPDASPFGMSPPAMPDGSPFGGSPQGFAPSPGLPPHSPAAPFPPAQAMPPASEPVAAMPDRGPIFLQAFCEGAGLSPELANDVPPAELGRALGQAMRAATSEVMLALRDRASAKQFVRVGERTMRGATDNNPLKFLPDPEQALETMFLRPRAGFQNGAAGFDEALRDLRQHQAALFAALQPALMRLLGDLAPEQIEAATEGGRFGGNKKGKAWDTFVQRWDAKAAPHENGMLDEFIEHFASAYRDALANQPQKRG